MSDQEIIERMAEAIRENSEPFLEPNGVINVDKLASVVFVAVRAMREAESEES